MELLIAEINKLYPEYLVMFTEYKDIYHIRLYKKPYQTNSQTLEDYQVNKRTSVKTIVRSLKETIERYINNLD